MKSRFMVLASHRRWAFMPFSTSASATYPSACMSMAVGMDRCKVSMQMESMLPCTVICAFKGRVGYTFAKSSGMKSCAMQSRSEWASEVLMLVDNRPLLCGVKALKSMYRSPLMRLCGSSCEPVLMRKVVRLTAVVSSFRPSAPREVAGRDMHMLVPVLSFMARDKVSMSIPRVFTVYTPSSRRMSPPERCAFLISVLTASVSPAVRNPMRLSRMPICPICIVQGIGALSVVSTIRVSRMLMSRSHPSIDAPLNRARPFSRSVSSRSRCNRPRRPLMPSCGMRSRELNTPFLISIPSTSNCL